MSTENLVAKNGFFPCTGCGTVRPAEKLKPRIVTVKIEQDGQTAEKITEQKVCADGWCIHAAEPVSVMITNQEIKP